MSQYYDEIKDSLMKLYSNATQNRTVERFTLNKVPSEQELKDIDTRFNNDNGDMARMAKEMGVLPSELYSVIVHFDLPPSSLSMKDRQLRLKYLDILIIFIIVFRRSRSVTNTF